MAVSFLYLELDNSGIKAQIVEQSNKQDLIKNDCHVMFEDLPDSEESKNPFDEGMNMVAQQLDLGSCSTAVIFVSPFSVFFRTIDMPFDSDKKITQILPFELETVLPYGNRTYISDFHRLGLKDSSNLILTASVPESDLETYFSVLGRYGIKPSIITHKGYAAAVTFLKHRPEVSSCIFIHVTPQAYTLVLVKDKKPCMTRVFKTASCSPENLVVSINRTILGFEQKTGLVSAFDIFVSSEDNDLCNRIYDALERSQDNQSRLSAAEQGGEKISAPQKTDGASLLTEIVPGKKIKFLFNFCKGRYGSSSFFETHIKQLTSVIVIACFVFVLSILNIHLEISNLKTQIATLDHKALSIFTSTFPDKKKIQDPFLQMKANVQEVIRKSGASGDKDRFIKNKNTTMIDIISECSRKITVSTDMEISRFLYNPGQIVLTGSTDNFNNVENIKGKMEASDLFETVSISSAAVDKKGDRVNFKFIIEM